MLVHPVLGFMKGGGGVAERWCQACQECGHASFMAFHHLPSAEQCETARAPPAPPEMASLTNLVDFHRKTVWPSTVGHKYFFDVSETLV